MAAAAAAAPNHADPDRVVGAGDPPDRRAAGHHRRAHQEVSSVHQLLLDQGTVARQPGEILSYAGGGGHRCLPRYASGSRGLVSPARPPHPRLARPCARRRAGARFCSSGTDRMRKTPGRCRWHGPVTVPFHIRAPFSRSANARQAPARPPGTAFQAARAPSIAAALAAPRQFPARTRSVVFSTRQSVKMSIRRDRPVRNASRPCFRVLDDRPLPVVDGADAAQHALTVAGRACAVAPVPGHRAVTGNTMRRSDWPHAGRSPGRRPPMGPGNR